MNNSDSLLNILLAPVNATCAIISSVANNIDLGVAREYDHEWTIQRIGVRNIKNDIWSYARYMLYQACVLNTTVKMSFNALIIYARPCAHEERALEVEKIVTDYDRKWAARSASHEFQNWVTRLIKVVAPTPKEGEKGGKRKDDSGRTMRQLERRFTDSRNFR